MQITSPNGQDNEGAGAKGAKRRHQVIAAAAACFRKEGFHGTSIARISKAAGMSPGHIYHYFPTKEAIVSAIVEDEESELAALIRALEEADPDGDFLELVRARIDSMIERSLDPDHRSLMLEIAAEGARNPVIASILQDSDRRVADRFAQLARRMSGASALGRADEADLRARLELLPVLISGLAARFGHKANAETPRMAALIKDAITYIWSAKA
ncbi:TetR/AcrR family transcriptional regulator [Sphingomonas sp. BGYR3]|uniref:TetR/AcrR family transcriptional regulator n=1 Tax=Sphingomonas sp. BGYR3 TaxID=2975483 RepID=UPI0021A56EE2|nr:TetR/AcrR family transcriptional regulator [Sphingomonas sp. BGYR3]MDG5487770.1 TetR/AcrR family transcriptional regulator [Sphingomonas sp. BGYR3]